AADQELHHQQQIAGQGPAVAAVVLPGAVLPRVAAESRLRETGGGVRRGGHHRPPAGGGGPGDRAVASGDRSAVPRGFPLRSGGELLSHDPLRPVHQGDDRRARMSMPAVELSTGMRGDARKGTKHTISVLVDNTPGVLMKVAGLFRRRGYNIHSLAVGVTEQPTVSRMIIAVEGEPEILEQIIKQLNKLIEVIKVNDVTGFSTVDRELALIKLNATPATRMEIMEICNVFRANVVDLTEKTMTLEVTGRSEKIDAILSLVQKYGVREMVRTGQVTLVRGAQPT